MSYLKLRSTRGNPYNLVASTDTNFFLEVDVLEDCDDLSLTYKEARMIIRNRLTDTVALTIQADLSDGQFVFNELIALSGFYKYKVIMLDLTTNEETELMYGSFTAS